MPDIQINALDGSTFSGYAALPAGKAGTGLILIHEIFGLNEDMRQRCDRLAAQGYAVLCPDLFWRQGAAQETALSSESHWDQAAKLYKNFDIEAGLRDLFATLAHLRHMIGFNGKVGTIGFCLGGRLAFLLASRSDIDCSVCYYGVGLDSLLDEVFDIQRPFLAHFGEQDKLVPPATQKRVLGALKRNELITTYVYPGADHGFARTGGAKFQAEAAALAEARTLAFLKDHLLV